MPSVSLFSVVIAGIDGQEVLHQALQVGVQAPSGPRDRGDPEEDRERRFAG
jgi:hypothetical protein